MNFTLKKSDLNFKVYTVEANPSTPGAKNDIAVISPVPMSNWIMSPDKPSGIPRTDGDVWIQYSVNGNTFNALKNNSMMIATISAWQYVDGAWVDREAVSCQGGEWVDLITYLYKAPDEYTGLTGGWTVSGVIVGSTAVAGITKENDGIRILRADGKFSALTHTKLFDLTKYAKVRLKFEPLSGYVDAFQIRITTNMNLGDGESGFYGRYIPTLKSDGYYEVPIDDVKGEYRIAIIGPGFLKELFLV